MHRITHMLLDLKPVSLEPSSSQTDGRIGGEVMRLKQPSVESNAGLRVGDIILYAGGRRILRAGSYAAALALAKSGQPFYLVVLRDKQEITLTLQPE